MATKPTVNKNTGIFAIVFCCSALLLAYTYYLIASNQQLDVQALALEPSLFQLKPRWALEIVSNGGFKGTLAALLVLMFQGVLYCTLSFLAAYVLLRDKWLKVSIKPKQDLPAKDDRRGIFSAEILGSELMVMLPKYRSGRDTEWKGGAIDKTPYRQDFYRIEQAAVGFKDSVKPTVYQRLYLAIYAMLKAHPDVPASLGVHHADTPLGEHSITVAKAVQAYYVTRDKVEPLASIAGLAHDLDKLLAYKSNGTSWTKNSNATHHNKYAAYIVSTQPEFQDLSEDDQSTLVLALRYYHDPQELPVGTSSRTEALIHALRLGDGYAIQEEKKASIVNLTDENLETINQSLLKTIAELNINSYMNTNSYAGGWSTPVLEYVLSPMSTILETMGKHLSLELNRKLQLGHEVRTFKHPAASVVTERLQSLGILMGQYKNFVSPRGLYDCRIGTQGFKAVAMLDKESIEKHLPGLVEKWGEAHYRIKITGITEDIASKGDSDVEDGDKAD